MVAGGKDLRAFGDDTEAKDTHNVFYPGYVSDAENAALMKHCKLFLHPAVFEGFGIPPLEAVACGAKQILVSDTPCMREVYGDCAGYIDLDTNPGNVDDTTPPKADPQLLLEKYSWEKSAEKLLDILKKA